MWIGQTALRLSGARPHPPSQLGFRQTKATEKWNDVLGRKSWKWGLCHVVWLEKSLIGCRVWKAGVELPGLIWLP